MSKEELLKYLIAEIDLIMHDKDYRFENANGTWYSRESCRDLTNEEVFEELRTELRQFADLEAKLAESEKALEAKESVNQMYKATLSLKDSDFSDLVRENAQLKQQLAKKDKEIEILTKQNKALVEEEDLLDKKLKELGVDCIENLGKSQNKKAIEQLKKVKENIKKVPITDFDLSGNFEKMYKQDAIIQINNQIEELKKEMK